MCSSFLRRKQCEMSCFECSRRHLTLTPSMSHFNNYDGIFRLLDLKKDGFPASSRQTVNNFIFLNSIKRILLLIISLFKRWNGAQCWKCHSGTAWHSPLCHRHQSEQIALQHSQQDGVERGTIITLESTSNLHLFIINFPGLGQRSEEGLADGQFRSQQWKQSGWRGPLIKPTATHKHWY